MWPLLYNVLLLLATPLILVVLLVKRRCRRGLPQRVGLRAPRVADDRRPVCWVHAVSLGEVVAVAPLLQALHVQYPHYRLVVSTVTETGREAVEQRLGAIAVHCYAPLDLPWAVARTIRALRPMVFLFVETELWPNLLRQLRRAEVPTILINGRLSTRSFGRYRLIRSFLAQVLADVSLLLVQSDRDRERFVALGAEPTKVVRTGNLKFDHLSVGPQAQGPDRRALGLDEHERVIVAGSTHPGEEDDLLTAYQTLLETDKDLVLVMAPRHIERVSSLEATIRDRGLAVVRRTSLPTGHPSGGPRVIILDTRGELATLYRHAVVAFVGGTLVPIGGHNLLEPAVWGRPVLFGPYTDHCEELADLLLQGEAARRVRDRKELSEVCQALLRDPAASARMGENGRRVIQENRGAVERTLMLLAPLLAAEAGSAQARRPVVVSELVR